MPPSSWLLAFQNHPQSHFESWEDQYVKAQAEHFTFPKRSSPADELIHFISDCWYQCVVDHHLPQEGWMECVRHNGEGHLIPGTTLPPPTVQCCRVTVLEGAICILSHLSNHFLTSLEISEPNQDYINEGFGLIQGFGFLTLPLAGSGNCTRNLLFCRSWTSGWHHHE